MLRQPFAETVGRARRSGAGRAQVRPKAGALGLKQPGSGTPPRRAPLCSNYRDRAAMREMRELVLEAPPQMFVAASSIT